MAHSHIIILIFISNAKI